MSGGVSREESACGSAGPSTSQTDESLRSKSPVDLIGFIVERYHETHRQELPLLAQLARKVEIVHAGRDDCPEGLSQLLTRMEAELCAHMQKEEQVLFPVLLASGGGCTPLAIQRMRIEHDDHAELLAELRQLTRDFVPPADAGGRWRRLYQGCAKLNGDLEAHIALENNALFPQFE